MSVLRLLSTTNQHNGPPSLKNAPSTGVPPCENERQSCSKQLDTARAKNGCDLVMISATSPFAASFPAEYHPRASWTATRRLLALIAGPRRPGLCGAVPGAADTDETRLG